MTRVSPRQEFSAKTKQKAFDRADGRCEQCGCKLFVGRWQCDHLVPAWQGGDNSLDNAQCLCTGCHQPKSAEDTRATAKADRLHRKHIGAKSKPRGNTIIPGSKASGWKRKINGEAERR